MFSRAIHRQLPAAICVILCLGAIANAWPWTNMDWVWEVPEHPHYQDLTVPDGITVNDLKVWIPYPPTGPDPFATGMPYNDDYDYGEGTMTFGPGGMTFEAGSSVGVSWTSKFASDLISNFQFTLDNTPVGPLVDMQNCALGYGFEYDDVGNMMTVSITNHGSLDAAFSEMRLAYCIPVEYLNVPGEFHEDAAYASGTAVTVLPSGSLLAGQTLVIGSFALDDELGVNNHGYILADATYTFSDSTSYRFAAGGIGTPEPATIGLLALGGAGLLRRRRH